MLGRVTFEDFIKVFDNKKELSTQEIEKHFNYRISSVTIRKYAKIAKENGLIEIEEKFYRSDNLNKKLFYKKVG